MLLYCIKYEIVISVEKSNDNSYNPHERDDDVYKHEYNELLAHRIWANEKYHLPQNGTRLEHYGFRFQFHYHSQTNFMQVPVLPDDHVMARGVRKAYRLLCAYPKLF